MCKRAQADNVLNLLEVRQVNDVTINNILIFLSDKTNRFYVVLGVNINRS